MLAPNLVRAAIRALGSASKLSNKANVSSSFHWLSNSTPASSLQFCSNRCLSTTTSCLARKFAPSHEWVDVAEDGASAKLGISRHAQEALGDLVYCQIVDVGQKLAAGDECAALESVKAASDVYSPVSGVITEKNEAAEADPALINRSPYDQGWLLKIDLTNASEVDSLMDEKAYEEFVANSLDQ